MPARALLALCALIGFNALAAADLASCLGASAPGVAVLLPGGGDFPTAVGLSLFPDPAPQALVRVSSTADVVAAVRCAREENLGVCVRGGGHSFTGKAHGNGCVMVDTRGIGGIVASGGQVTAGAGVTLGEVFLGVLQGTGGAQMLGVGICPSVGLAGYISGGGFGAYSARNGLTCENLVDIEMVGSTGEILRASASENQELFWASCGGGGGALGVITRMTLNTRDATPFNNNVYFRYEWPRAVAGQVIRDHIDYDNEGGLIWARGELSAREGANGQGGFVVYGACFESTSVSDCETRLSKSAFFNVPGRETRIAQVATTVAEFQKFLGPPAGFSRRIPTASDEEAFVGTYGEQAGLGFQRTYASMYTRYEQTRPPVEVFQSVADAIFTANRDILGFLIIQFNPWRNGETDAKPQFSFPHRGMNELLEFIGGNDDAPQSQVEAVQTELGRVIGNVQDIFRPYLGGIYVNYPEFDLSDEEYPYLYYGNSLERLAELRATLDPAGVFSNKQQMPSGDIACPGTVDFASVSETRMQAKIEGYPFGQLTGMRVEVAVSPPDCVLTANEGAAVSRVDDDVFEMYTDSTRQWTFNKSQASCMVSLTSINGVSCDGGCKSS